ncbi:MAG: hypothetical protein QW818_03320 [Candidatus Aenigmatarchaeota archaeon]|nr:hypothetical protein [Candidatus Aenigmarchaeota archaeon]
MVFESTLLDVGVAVLVVVALASFAKQKGKGWNWLAVGGVFFLFAGTLSAATTLAGFLGSVIWGGIASLFEVVGLIFAVVGTVLVGYEALVEK